MAENAMSAVLEKLSGVLLTANKVIKKAAKDESHKKYSLEIDSLRFSLPSRRSPQKRHFLASGSIDSPQ